jgi:hypothetical protein
MVDGKDGLDLSACLPACLPAFINSAAEAKGYAAALSKLPIWSSNVRGGELDHSPRGAGHAGPRSSHLLIKLNRCKDICFFMK